MMNTVVVTEGMTGESLAVHSYVIMAKSYRYYLEGFRKIWTYSEYTKYRVWSLNDRYCSRFIQSDSEKEKIKISVFFSYDIIFLKT